MGIETSCDDSSVGIVSDGDVIANIVFTQKVHAEWGGVIPELASRDHIRTIIPTIDQAIKLAGITLKDLDSIAVCAGPGLLGSLLVGLCTGKAIARARNIPLVGVHHLEGHLFAGLTGSNIAPPFDALLVSGGHSHIYRVPEFGKYELLGKTRDDAAGEAFDKGAKAMGLPYPGGPSIERTAKGGNPRAFNFPRAMQTAGELDMSFSGLKTSLLNTLNAMTPAEVESRLADLCASYQEAIADALVWKLAEAAKRDDFGGKIVAVGGVVSNSTVREKIKNLCETNGWQYSLPGREYCTDNGAMIALAGEFRHKKGDFASWNITAVSRWPLETL